MSTIITPALTDQLIAALCNTLVYSLLLGILLAAAAALVIVSTRRVRAVVRYNLLTALLLLFIVAAAVTFTRQLGRIQIAAPTDGIAKTTLQAGGTAPISTGNVVENAYKADLSAAPSQAPGFVATASAFLNTLRNAIVTIWFIFICLQSVQLAFGLRVVYRLKNKNVAPASAEWQNKLDSMAARIGLKQYVALLESGLAKVPMAIGHLRPVILMPVSLLTALSIEQVEAILMHELAHIRRRDYLVNLLQAMVEVVFFFNPAVLWVSSLIKTERENCCDDIALAQSSNKAEYITALMTCEEYQQSTPAYAMAFPGRKNQLVERATRMISNRNNSLSLLEKTLLTACLVISGLCFTAYAEKENIKKVAKAVVEAIKPIIGNSEISSDDIIAQQKAEEVKKQQMVLPVANDQQKTDTIIKPTGQPAIAQKSPVKLDTAYTLKPYQKVNAKLIMRMDSVYIARGYNDAKHMAYDIDSEPDTVKQPNNRPIMDSIYKEMKKDGFVGPMKMTGRGGKPLSPELQEKYKNVVGPLGWGVKDNKFYVEGRELSAELEKKYSDIYKNYKPRRPVPRSPLLLERSRYISNHIVVEMLRDGLTKDGDALSFVLNYRMFYINGKQQPPAVFQKYYDEFIKPIPGNKGQWAWQ
ncbi:MAG: M56 family metallopeptidase [Bacteroidota bacterium]